MKGRKGSSGSVAVTTDKKRRIEKKAEAASSGARGTCTRRRKAQSKISALLSEQSLAYWPFSLAKFADVLKSS